MRFLFKFNVLLILTILAACKTTQKVVEMPIVENTLLDTLTVTAPKALPESFELPRYNPAADRIIDLIHMDLEISFDWEKEQVFGNSILTIRPYFYKTDEIVLDAYNMEIKDVTLNGEKALEFENSQQKLLINLDREYTREESIKIYIQYIASPSMGRVTEGYNPSDLGLYFIDSQDSDPDKPSQIWSQGETEYNSRWFPTVDKPNERYTHDIKITVEDKYATLSNGYLVSTNKYDKETRTDHWRMDDEHAPYLTMITVGEFAVVRDQWKGKPLLYYVEKEYEPYAKNIFNHTPEMLTFFSDLTGVSYPWDQYAQVVIRDFVAGAMENTTAVTFGEFVQKTDNELIDNHNDDIVAHEMFHHWFGDYVTCESWAHLTLNEGFANYSEYLWTEYKYGKDEADHKRNQEIGGYMYQALNQGVHPLIHYGYEDKENMFDGHSYNKGGLVLHMLRAKIGDEAFFAGMKKYLQDNAGTSVEVDELRIAYEDVTGLDLQQFFNQWYLSSGHPELEINYSINGSDLEVVVEQVQSPTTSIPIFQIPLEFDIYDKKGKIVRHGVEMNQRKQTFNLSSMGGDIDWVNVDPDHILLATFSENKTKEDYIKELTSAKRQYDINEALDALRGEEVDVQLYKDLLVSDKHYWLKWKASGKVPYTTADKALFEEAIMNAKNVFLKGRLIANLKEHSKDFDDAFFIKQIEENISWNVRAPSLGVLATMNPSKTQEYIKAWKEENNVRLVFTIADILAQNNQFDQFHYITEKVPSISPRSLRNYNKIIVQMISSAQGEDLRNVLSQLNQDVMSSDRVSKAKKAVIGNGLIELQNKLSEEQKIIFKEVMGM